MHQSEWDSLDVGDIIRHKMASDGMVVQANYRKSGVLITRCQLASNPREWDLISKAERDASVSFEDGSESLDEVPEGFTPHTLIEELRDSFTNRMQNAEYHAEHGNFKERWEGTVMALKVCLAKLEVMERELTAAKVATP